jgi:hypothetical protein
MTDVSSEPGIWHMPRSLNMLLYALICLSLTLVGVAGLQFTYLFYLDRVDKERKKLIHQLEGECRRLSRRLTEAESRVAEQDLILNKLLVESGDEAWADIIEER